MTEVKLDEIVKMLRENHAEAVESEGDYYADQFSFHGGEEAADAIQWLRGEVDRLKGAADTLWKSVLKSEAESSAELVRLKSRAWELERDCKCKDVVLECARQELRRADDLNYRLATGAKTCPQDSSPSPD
jgi:hypothetical protein